MFETRPSSEIPFPEAIGGDSKFWSYVKLHLHQPWFYLVIEGGDAPQIVLATHREQWVSLNDVYPSMRIGSIDLVSPSWLNGSSAWKMEPLRQVWVGTDAGSHEAVVYVVGSGARYVECAGSKGEDGLSDLTLIFEASSKQKRRSGKQ